MTRLEEIYKRVVNELPESRRADQELSARIREAAERIDCPEEQRAALREAMYTGSSYGHISGFMSGFRFAVQLFIETLV